jgi:hypothetical protein
MPSTQEQVLEAALAELISFEHKTNIRLGLTDWQYLLKIDPSHPGFEAGICHP